MRRACIDIGANTTRLLVAECDGDQLVPVHQERAFTRIGQSLDEHGQIPQRKLTEVVAAVATQLAIARALGAAQLRCVATAGVRRAANGERLVELVANSCGGTVVEVLSGEQEARLAFLGAAWAVRGSTAPGALLAVADVGGGSTELVVGESAGEVLWWRSLPLGSADLLSGELDEDPPGELALARASGRVREAFADISPPAVDHVIAVGGSATSLVSIAGVRLDREALQEALRRRSALTAAEFAARSGLEAERARLLPGGLLILAQLVELFGKELTVGAGGLREGVLLDAAATSGCP